MTVEDAEQIEKKIRPTYHRKQVGGYPPSVKQKLLMFNNLSGDMKMVCSRFDE